MTNGNGAPENLCHQDRPQVAGGTVTRREKELIAGRAAHRFRMPEAERGAPHVDRHSLGNVAAADALGGAAQAEIHILQVGFEGFLKQSHLPENFRAVEHGRPWRRGDVARLVERWRIAVPGARAPCGGAPAGQVKAPIEQAGGTEDLAGGESSVRGGELFQSEERRVGKEGRSRWSPYH